MMPPSKSKTLLYSEPLVFGPLKNHETTLIILHGRGSTAQKFAEPLLTHPVSGLSAAVDSTKTFRDCLPNTRFVFPTAPLRRAIVFKRSLIHQWFDTWSLTEPELKQHLQVQGLRETSAYVHDLLNKEIEIIGAKNVVLMGLSQGCASSLVSTLLWEGEPFRAVVGMCGYLPFRKGMADTLVDQGQEEDPFARSDDEDGVDMFERGGDIPGPEETNFEKAIGWLREELQIEKEQEKHTEPPRVPVFMGHGSEDEKVPVALGKLAAELLGDVGMCVEWKEYDGLGHWYSEHMLKDVIAFLMGLEGGGSNVDGNKVTWGI